VERSGSGNNRGYYLARSRTPSLASKHFTQFLLFVAPPLPQHKETEQYKYAEKYPKKNHFICLSVLAWIEWFIVFFLGKVSGGVVRIH
jgi:hypothetical protein